MSEEILEAPQVTEPKPTNWPKIISAAVLGLSLLAASAYAGYYYGTQQVQQIEKPSPISQPTPTPTPTPTPSEPSPTVTPEVPADWKTYNNTNYGYSIKLPPDWGEWSVETGSWEFSREIGQSELVLLGDYEGPPTKTAEGIIIVPQKLDVAVHLNTSKSDWVGELQKPEGECSETPIIISEQHIQVSKILCPGFRSVTYLIEKGYDLYRITKGKEFAEFDQILSTFKFLD